MNGAEIERITRLEVKFDERWDSHDKRSEEVWDYIKGKLDKLPCEKNVKDIQNNTSFRLTASKALWILFIALIGLVFKEVIWLVINNVNT